MFCTYKIEISLRVLTQQKRLQMQVQEKKKVLWLSLL